MCLATAHGALGELELLSRVSIQQQKRETESIVRDRRIHPRDGDELVYPTLESTRFRVAHLYNVLKFCPYCLRENRRCVDAKRRRVGRSWKLSGRKAQHRTTR
jgi:hypothetical protein